MDTTELIALATGVSGAVSGFLLGLRVCGPRLQITWTERHPREVAEQVHDGQVKLSQLTAHSRRLVVDELARMGNGLPIQASADFLALTGIEGRYVGRPDPDWTHRIEVQR